MTKFTNLIKPDSTELERYFLSVYTGNLWDALEKIKDWHSPEHIEKEVQMKLLKLQQQALPVVPECVGVAIEKDKQANISISDVFEATFSYENHHLTEAGLWTKNNPEKYIIARNIGYTVEKPQLFYLREKNTNYYLNKSKNNGLELVPNPYFDEDNQFTKQEIDSMQTGSYEQIEVKE